MVKASSVVHRSVSRSALTKLHYPRLKSPATATRATGARLSVSRRRARPARSGLPYAVAALTVKAASEAICSLSDIEEILVVIFFVGPLELVIEDDLMVVDSRFWL